MGGARSRPGSRPSAGGSTENAWIEPEDEAPGDPSGVESLGRVGVSRGARSGVGLRERARLRVPRSLSGVARAHADRDPAGDAGLVQRHRGRAARRARAGRRGEAAARRGARAGRVQRRVQRRGSGGADGDAPACARDPAVSRGHGRSARRRAARHAQQGQLPARGRAARHRRRGGPVRAARAAAVRPRGGDRDRGGVRAGVGARPDPAGGRSGGPPRGAGPGDHRQLPEHHAGRRAGDAAGLGAGGRGRR